MNEERHRIDYGAPSLARIFPGDHDLMRCQRLKIGSWDEDGATRRMDEFADINVLATHLRHACDNEVTQPSSSRKFLRWITNSCPQLIHASFFLLEFFFERLQATFDIYGFKAHEFIIHDHPRRGRRYNANVTGSETDECRFEARRDVTRKFQLLGNTFVHAQAHQYRVVDHRYDPTLIVRWFYKSTDRLALP
ncbi:hypothetical protein DEU52_11833 [Ensifer adhaerens]|nr:hypothetical protein DEU52_11833 [Ensifer adhaerens]